MKKSIASLIMTGTVMLCITFIGKAAAQNRGDENLSGISVEQALTLALKNSHEYRIAQMNLKESKEKVSAVWGQLMPAIESEASVVRQGAESGFMSLSDGQYDIKVAQLKFGINPGAFYQSLKQSHAGYSIAKEEIKKVRSTVEFNVIKGYFDVMLAKEVVQLRKNSIQVLEENLKDVNRLHQTGSVPKFELLQAQVQLKNLEPSLREAENNYRTAVDFFNYNLGNVNACNTADQVSGKSIMDPQRPGVEEKLIEFALIHRPDVVQVSLQKEASDRARKTYQSSYLWPFISIGGYYGWTYLLPNSVDMDFPGGISPDFSNLTGKREWQETWQVRVAATYRWSSLLPVDSQRALEREQKEKIKEAEERLIQVRRLTAITVRSLYGKLCTAYEAILSQEKNVETAEEGLRIARESYRAGVIKNADLLSAELSLTSARMGYIKGLYDYYVSMAELDRETGMQSSDIIFRENTNE
ncbi:MAG TPA: TolC family protein [Spirochaetota bacterium]|nr:TolC family protein [Spirochaetota bacterium]HPI90371.1 TolC family protein [Spirochaetota bacterium]HPR47531.1 TolC family protein [Spirochaetota bacterium]